MLKKEGLYEHDNCDAGFICNLNGEKRNDIIHKTLTILVRLKHRGAVSSDGKTGDGVGILIDIPQDINKYYIDLNDKDVVTRLTLVHQRFSTNTFSTWDFALLSLGFIGPEKTLSEALNLKTVIRSNIIGDNYKTNNPNVFVAGDVRRGQSLIVWAISEGRESAYHIDTCLMGRSSLARKEKGDLPTIK